MGFTWNRFFIFSVCCLWNATAISVHLKKERRKRKKKHIQRGGIIHENFDADKRFVAFFFFSTKEIVNCNVGLRLAFDDCRFWLIREQPNYNFAHRNWSIIATKISIFGEFWLNFVKWYSNGTFISIFGRRRL